MGHIDLDRYASYFLTSVIEYFLLVHLLRFFLALFSVIQSNVGYNVSYVSYIISYRNLSMHPHILENYQDFTKIKIPCKTTMERKIYFLNYCPFYRFYNDY